MRHLLTFALLLLGLQVSAQVQWASVVLKSSSSYSNVKTRGQFKSREALGPPSIMPGFGQSPCAWTPSREATDKGEVLILGFDDPQAVQQLHIHENFGAGAIDRIWLQDTDGKAHTVYNNPNPQALETPGRFWNLPIRRTDYEVQAIKLHLNTAAVRGFCQIDAVGISDSDAPFRPRIHQAEDIALTAAPRNIGPGANAKGEELCPVISPDGRILYFTRMNHPGNVGNAESQDIWQAEMLENGLASEATNLGEPLNNPFNSSLTSITPDGQTALLLNKYLPDGSMDNGISMARWQGDGWGMPEEVVMDDFYNHNVYGEFCLSSSGKVMVLAIERDDAVASKDLYISFRRDDDTWTAPIRLPDVLNTADGETSPFLAADDQTLYFSSAGHPGYGSKDMYVTRRIGDSWTEWTQPENLGPQLNTPGWDAYYTVPANGQHVYFVSYKDDGYGTADIYRAPLPEALRPKPVVLLRGTVTDKKTGKPLGTEIRYHALADGNEIGIAHSDPVTGAYSIVLPAGDRFGFSSEKIGYLPIFSDLDLRGVKVYEELHKDLEMAPIEVGVSIVLNNIYFDVGKYDLRRESFNELDKLAEVLRANPGMQVEISGHTDNVGSDAANLTLSKNRAQAVTDYLLGKELESSRFMPKGFGEEQPAFPNDSASNRQKNRRVEFKILKI